MAVNWSHLLNKYRASELASIGLELVKWPRVSEMVVNWSRASEVAKS